MGQRWCLHTQIIICLDRVVVVKFNTVCLRSYPDVGHRSMWVEELADDVGGGCDAEDDGAQDLLPPGQQQYGVLLPATLIFGAVSLYEADSGVTLFTLAIGEVVAVVYREETVASAWGFRG